MVRGRTHRGAALIGASAVLSLFAGLIGALGPASAHAAQRPPVQEPRLVFATFNVCKVFCAAPAPSWEVRRTKVAQVIAESGADVVGLQEVTNHAVSSGRTQRQDVQDLTASLGYEEPQFPVEANECRRPRDAAGELAGPSPCDNTAGLLYRSSTVRQLPSPNGMPTAGIVQLGSIAAMDPESAKRSVMWAYLEGLNGAGPLLAVSVHTASAKTPEAEASRMMIGGALAGWAVAMNERHGFPGVPVILLADLNSYAKRQPSGVQAVLARNGWVDAFTAPTRRNIQYSTINYNPQLVDGFGFPAKPYVFRKSTRNKLGAATRIDYIMAFGPGVRMLDYEVVIRLNPNGTFNEAYQASDHQMVRATLAFSA